MHIASLQPAACRFTWRRCPSVCLSECELERTRDDSEPANKRQRRRHGARAAGGETMKAARAKKTRLAWSESDKSKDNAELAASRRPLLAPTCWPCINIVAALLASRSPGQPGRFWRLFRSSLGQANVRRVLAPRKPREPEAHQLPGRPVRELPSQWRAGEPKKDSEELHK